MDAKQDELKVIIRTETDRKIMENNVKVARLVSDLMKITTNTSKQKERLVHKYIRQYLGDHVADVCGSTQPTDLREQHDGEPNAKQNFRK